MLASAPEEPKFRVGSWREIALPASFSGNATVLIQQHLTPGKLKFPRM
jgi:hypothetical protein